MMKIACRALLGATLCCSSFGLLWAQAPDNTKMNQGDTQTADKQGNNSADIEMTRQIRKALVHDKSLSTYGHNVKIITQQGMVTLKGPVKDEAEKQEIESKAVAVAGSADKINSQLMVAGSAKDKPSANPDQQ